MIQDNFPSPQRIQAAIQKDNEWWQRRIQDTRLPDETLARPMYFKPATDPGVAAKSLGTAVLTVCHNGVPATRRFSCSPPSA